MMLLPKSYSENDAARGLSLWLESAERQLEPALVEWMRGSAQEGSEWRPLLTALFGNSPFLSGLALRHPDIVWYYATGGADTAHERVLGALNDAQAATPPELMACLRQAKGRLALLTAVADITQSWALPQVTQALSGFAEKCLDKALGTLLAHAHKCNEITLPNPGTPCRDCGIIVLGMGKLGARELNYSSDIDLIILFEAGRLNYSGRHNEQKFMNKLAQDLVHIMQERTTDGYVFRTDLRLRPDPASTPPAINTEAAHYYYESVGQNWERAAMIKARAVAGDIAAGERFLKNIAPFMWRRSLDFAAIQDIHSIKRQMDSKQNKDINVRGHNVKLGMGGIREIEFFAQIHQLIWGGKQPRLRTRGTLETLEILCELTLIDATKRDILTEAYRFYRTLEHRLQMIADQQTHTIPAAEDDLQRVACFMGYNNTDFFIGETLSKLHAVHTIFANSFQSSEKLGGEGSLVFTGVTHDPDTLQTLANMGYASPETVSEIVMGWHHGSKRATRTKRARELLTELMPTLLTRLAETASPDTAFLKFNDFLTNLPAGVQLFSLFNVNPHLLGLLADIMGSAPTLADYLSKSPGLLDAVLYADFYGPLPAREQLDAQLHAVMPQDADFEAVMDTLRRFRNEKQFQAGVQLLRQMIDAHQAGAFLSDLADLMVQSAVDAVKKQFCDSAGAIAGSRFAVIALGRLGSRDITFGSDIDLVFVYDASDDAMSDGAKPFNASMYFHRLTQRVLGALTTMGRDGRLYEVDMRLRPSGGQGLLISSLEGFMRYFEESAWTFEFMAFTKARVIAGDASLARQLETFILGQIARPRDIDKLRADVIDMRKRIDKEFGTDNIWDIKYMRGGLIDVDFIAQYLLLKHAPELGKAITGGADEVLVWLSAQGCMVPDIAEENHTLTQLLYMLRLCSDGALHEEKAMPGLKKLLYESLGMDDFTALKARLIAVEQRVKAFYTALIATP